MISRIRYEHLYVIQADHIDDNNATGAMKAHTKTFWLRRQWKNGQYVVPSQDV